MGANLMRSFNVTPAKARVQRPSRMQAAERLDPRFRGDDKASGRLPGKVTADGIKSGDGRDAVSANASAKLSAYGVKPGHDDGWDLRALESAQ